MTAFADRTVVTIAVRGPLMCRVDTQWDLVIKRGTWGRAGQGKESRRLAGTLDCRIWSGEDLYLLSLRPPLSSSSKPPSSPFPKTQ